MIQKQNLWTFLAAGLKIGMGVLNNSKQNIAIGFFWTKCKRLNTDTTVFYLKIRT